MKVYKELEDKLIQGPDGQKFVAAPSDDLYNQMRAEIEAGEAELIDHEPR